MASTTLSSLVREIATKGERTKVDEENSIFEASELVLVAKHSGKKVVPVSVAFTLFGVDFTIDSSERVFMVEHKSDEDVSSYEVEDDTELKRVIMEFINFRLKALQSLGL